MSTIKISELPVISAISANTANTIFIGLDIPTNVTGKMTLTTLASGLYSNNTLAVGNNYTILPNVVGQFTGNSVNYIQVNLQNQLGNGSGDIVVTADTGDDSNYYVDMGMNGSTYNYPGYTYAKPLDGYVIVQGSVSDPTLPGGNLVIGTTTAGKTVSFLQGTTDANGIVAQFIANTGFKLTKKPLIFADGTTQNTAVTYTSIDARVSSNISIVNNSITTNVAALNGSITANGVSANSAINSRITANIATANLFTQAAFDKANNALANSSIIHTAGDFYTSGDGFVNGTFTLANSNFSSTQAAMTIKATATTAVPSNDGYMLHISGKANTPSRIVFDSYSTSGNAYGLIAGRTARGTVTTPTATQNNDILMRMSGNGWGTTGFAPLGVARVDIIATENYSDSARGSAIKFYNIANGSNTVQEIATFNANTIHFMGAVTPEKGFAYSPNNITSNATSYTIDFNRDSMVRMSCNDNMSIALTNYQIGKIVEVWVTNGANQNKTVTHGCLANNSTAKSTTFTIQANACAFLKYFSIDGDNQNTFVSITA